MHIDGDKVLEIYIKNAFTRVVDVGTKPLTSFTYLYLTIYGTENV